jgi:hypothetical protein
LDQQHPKHARQEGVSHQQGAGTGAPAAPAAATADGHHGAAGDGGEPTKPQHTPVPGSKSGAHAPAAASHRASGEGAGSAEAAVPQTPWDREVVKLTEQLGKEFR